MSEYVRARFPRSSMAQSHMIHSSTAALNFEKMGNRVCRLCHSPLVATFVDLGMSPLCESYLTSDQLDQMETFYPLHVFVCENCFLVQLPEYVKPKHIF